jgi:hypothetical protein
MSAQVLVDLLLEHDLAPEVKQGAASWLYQNLKRSIGKTSDLQIQELLKGAVNSAQQNRQPEVVVVELWPTIALLAAHCKSLNAFDDFCKYFWPLLLRR